MHRILVFFPPVYWGLRCISGLPLCIVFVEIAVSSLVSVNKMRLYTYRSFRGYGCQTCRLYMSSQWPSVYCTVFTAIRLVGKYQKFRSKCYWSVLFGKPMLECSHMPWKSAQPRIAYRKSALGWVHHSSLFRWRRRRIGEGGRPGNIHGNNTSRTFMNGFQWRLYDSIRQMKQISMSNLILQIVHHLSFNQAQPYQIFYWFLSIWDARLTQANSIIANEV